MRTNVTSIVANRTVFGYGQDRVVVSLQDESCARATQHLHLRHASKRASGMTLALKRLWSAATGAGWAPRAMCTCMAITGPARPTVRLASSVVVGT